MAEQDAANITNVALIFGVTGLVGKEIAKRLVETPGWKVYGVARNPDVLPVRDSNYYFISCDLLDRSRTTEKLCCLDDVTHIYWITWASQFMPDTPECCDQNKGMMLNALDAILPRAKNLKHVSLQTGVKHYVSLSDFSNENSVIRDYDEETPRATDGHNFYYALEDSLKDKLPGNVTWSVHRPGMILGSSQSAVYNVMGCLCVYGTLCKHLKLPFIFGGTKECWEEVYLDFSDARLVAEQHIWASTNTKVTSTQGQAFNAINGSRSTWKEIWPVLAMKFGADPPVNMFSQEFFFSEFMADKEDVWDEIVTKEGLRRTKLENLANWEFLDMLFRCPVKMLGSRDKADRLGFKVTYRTLDSILYWTERMRVEKLIPGISTSKL